MVHQRSPERPVGRIGRTHVSVTKALSMGRVKEPKTGKSRRVPLIAPLRSDLLQWRFACGGGKGEDPVFPNYRGAFWTEPDTRAWAGRKLKPALEAAGLSREVRAYDLRHSHVSMLIASGLNPVEVARRAGHSPTMTMDVYAHVFEEYEGRRIDFEDEVRVARAAHPQEQAEGGESYSRPFRARPISRSPRGGIIPWTRA